MLGTPPVPQALAHDLLRLVAAGDESPGALVTAAEHVHARLRAGLSVFFGQTGFNSLWGRALSLAAPSMAGGAAMAAAAPRVPGGWAAALEDHTAAETRAVLLAVFTSFIALLFTFVGTDVGSRLLYQVLPELPLDAPGPSTGDVPR